jgi:hypothetical protein
VLDHGFGLGIATRSERRSRCVMAWRKDTTVPSGPRTHQLVVKGCWAVSQACQMASKHLGLVARRS